MATQMLLGTRCRRQALVPQERGATLGLWGLTA
jgi:hypothetical protein